MENADLFYKLQRFDLLGAWLSKIAETYDKNYKLIDRYLKKRNSLAVNAAVIALIKSGRKELVPWLGQKLIKTGNLNLRQSILKYFRYASDVRALKYIMKFRMKNLGKLNNSEKRLLYRSIGALGKRPEERLLLSLLLKTRKGVRVKSKKLQESLLEAVSECGGFLTLRFFKRYIKKGGFLYSIRDKVAEALVYMKDANPGPFLFSLESLGMHKSIIKVLSKRRIKGGSEFLAKLYKKYKKSGYSMFDFARALEKQEYKKVKQIFVDLLKSDNFDFNTATIVFSVLKRENDKFPEKIVLKQISKEKDLQTVSLMIDYLGQIKSIRSIKILKAYLKHSAPGVRFLASRALMRITGKSYKFKGFND